MKITNKFQRCHIAWLMGLRPDDEAIVNATEFSFKQPDKIILKTKMSITLKTGIFTQGQ